MIARKNTPEPKLVGNAGGEGRAQKPKRAAPLTAGSANDDGSVPLSARAAPRPRRMARDPVVPPPPSPISSSDSDSPTDVEARSNPTPTKLSIIADLLKGVEGASMAELTAATGWQAHSLRGAIAGALKARGLVIISEKVDGVRRYRAETPQ